MAKKLKKNFKGLFPLLMAFIFTFKKTLNKLDMSWSISNIYFNMEMNFMKYRNKYNTTKKWDNEMWHKLSIEMIINFTVEVWSANSCH